MHTCQFGSDTSSPHLLITGGVHGDEFEPIAAIRRLIDLFDGDSARVESLDGRLTLVPIVNETYDPQKGPPSRNLARIWAAECDGLAVFDTYPSIMLAVEEAHTKGCNPRQALEQKIAHLRERSAR